MRFRIIAIVVAVAIAGAAACFFVLRTPADDSQLILGKWSVVKWDDYGNSQRRELIDGTEIEFTREKFRMLNSGGIPDNTYVLDSTKSPKWITLKEPIKSREGLGIYELSGDDLKICLETRAISVRPNAFESKHEPPNNMLFVLKRKKP